MPVAARVAFSRSACRRPPPPGVRHFRRLGLRRLGLMRTEPRVPAQHDSPSDIGIIAGRTSARGWHHAVRHLLGLSGQDRGGPRGFEAVSARCVSNCQTSSVGPPSASSRRPPACASPETNPPPCLLPNQDETTCFGSTHSTTQAPPRRMNEKRQTAPDSKNTPPHRLVYSCAHFFSHRHQSIHPPRNVGLPTCMSSQPTPSHHLLPVQRTKNPPPLIVSHHPDNPRRMNEQRRTVPDSKTHRHTVWFIRARFFHPSTTVDATTPWRRPPGL